jgi:rubrerythrin
MALEEKGMVNEQVRTLEALKIAIRMEVDGKAYYLKASQSSQNKIGQVLFKSLAAEEDIHRQKFEEIFKDIQSKKAWPDVKFQPHKAGELRSLFAEASQSVQATNTELEAVKTAMDMENKTFDFYREQANKAGFATEKQYYETLAGQESIHHAVLLDYFEYLKDPAGWFTMKERHSLDGG